MKKTNFAALAAVILCLTAFTACGETATENSTAPEIDSVNVVTDAAEEDEAEAETTVAEEDTAETDTTAAKEDPDSTETTAAPEKKDSDSDESSTQEDSVTEQDDQPAAEQNEPQDDPKPAETDAPDEKEPFLLDELHIGKDCTAYIAAHKDYSMEEAPSCIGSGLDRVYTYADIELQTYVENGEETARQITFLTDKPETRKGIRLGSSKADVISAYGEPEEEDFYVYQTEDGELQFFFDGESVFRIQYFTRG